MFADIKEIARFWWLEWQNARAIRHNKRAESYIVNRVKTEWLFSGVSRDDHGFYSDAGFTRSPHPMNRAQALRYFSRLHPLAVVNHIDDKNKIITFTGR